MSKRSASKVNAAPISNKKRRGMEMAPPPCRWPLGLVPVEIFQLICNCLPRTSVQSMRLVCREFDSMVSAHYFRNVVAPFRAALYGSPNNHSGALAAGSAGGEELRTVFHLFGDHIRAFALALELNELDLSFPAEKLTQQVIKTPWGLYRWPLREYQRYSDLEAIEDQADETALLTSSFSKLDKLSELGLSCDAGLGFLQGPDLNRHVARTLPRVFKTARYDPGLLACHEPDEPLEHCTVRRYGHLQRMMVNAGYSKDEIPGAIEYLKTCEGRRSPHRQAEDTADEQSDLAPIALNHDGYFAQLSAMDVNLPPLLRTDGSTTALDILMLPQPQEPAAEDDAPNPQGQPAANWLETQMRTSLAKPAKETRAHPLEPQSLTPAQREMLLEMTWAHEALVQSYAISIMDNQHAFGNVRSFTIARIPGRLVHALTRPGLWDSLPAVEEFSLGIIPDWRDVRKLNGVIEDLALSPLDSTGPAHRLLQVVSTRKRITKLHFEWICGGELSTGAGQRNRYVLPAPFFPDPTWMVTPEVLVNRATAEKKLWLPHVAELSLKNCWFSPHVLVHTAHTMSAASLTTLKLETVSLSGPIQFGHATSYLSQTVGSERNTSWPWPLCIGAMPGRVFNFHDNAVALGVAVVNAGAGNANTQNQWDAFALGGEGQLQMMQAQPVAAPGLPLAVPGPTPIFSAHDATANNTASRPDAHVWQGPLKTPWVPVPKLMSWAHILDEITPHQTLAEKYSNYPHKAGGEEDAKWLSRRLEAFVGNLSCKRRLPNIEFKSCGYVLVDAEHVNNHEIIPNAARLVGLTPAMPERLRSLDNYMLKSADVLLAKVLDDFNAGEHEMLARAFDMAFGWPAAYPRHFELAAHEDGFLHQGRYRFSGGWSDGLPIMGSGGRPRNGPAR